MKQVAHIPFVSVPVSEVVICMPISDRQANTLWPIKGMLCFSSLLDAELYVLKHRTSADALCLASIADVGFALIGHAKL